MQTKLYQSIHTHTHTQSQMKQLPLFLLFFITFCQLSSHLHQSSGLSHSFFQHDTHFHTIIKSYKQLWPSVPFTHHDTNATFRDIVDV